MVVFVHDYRSFESTSPVYTGNGLRGFSLSGFGLSEFSGSGLEGFSGSGLQGFGDFEEQNMMLGDGVGTWLKQAGRHLVNFGRKALPWAVDVGKRVVAESGKELAGMVADEIVASNPDSNLAKIGSVAVKRAGSVAASQAKKGLPKKAGALTNISADVGASASKDLLAQMLANRRKYQEGLAARNNQSGEGVMGFGGSVNDNVSFS